MRWETDVVKKCKENTNLMTSRCHLFRLGKHKNKTLSRPMCSLVLHGLSILKYLDYEIHFKSNLPSPDHKLTSVSSDY